jgi:hypothetical protein
MTDIIRSRDLGEYFASLFAGDGFCSLVFGQLWLAAKNYATRLGAFPRAIRKANPVPSRFLVLAKLSDMDGGSEFIHTNHAWGLPQALDDEFHRGIVVDAGCGPQQP